MGKAWTLNRDARARSAAPSTFPTLTLRFVLGSSCLEWRFWAMSSYVDAKRVQ